MAKIEEILPEIRNGRRFRRVGKSQWCSLTHENFTLITLIENDWELEPKKVEATKEQLMRIWDAANEGAQHYVKAWDSMRFSETLEELKIKF